MTNISTTPPSSSDLINKNISSTDKSNSVVLSVLTLPKYGKNGFAALSKEIIKKILRRTRGPDQVANSLKRGLDELGVAYNFNPKIKDLAQTVHVLSGVQTLKQAIELKKSGKIKTLITGPSITITPLDENKIMQNPEIDTIVLPAKWPRDLFISLVPSLQNKIEVWPSGVENIYDTEAMSLHSKLMDTKPLHCIIYQKNSPIELRTIIDETLEKMNISSTNLVYGNFKQIEYFNYLKSANFVIFLSPSESQGLAMQEAWIRGIPTLVWNRGYWSHGGLTWKDEKISAPYLTDTCGMFFSGVDEFKTKLEQFVSKLGSGADFKPREYVLENLTDRHSAKRLLEIAGIQIK